MKRKRTIILVATVLIVAFWFLGVDRSWFVEECPDCGFGRDIIQYRVFTIPIFQHTKDYGTVLQKIATDIGAECKHPEILRWHKHRYWGLLVCAYPCINGTVRLSGGNEWYDDKAQAIVKEMVRSDPSLREDVAERILKNHDWEYLKTFYDRVSALREGKPAKTQ